MSEEDLPKRRLEGVTAPEVPAFSSFMVILAIVAGAVVVLGGVLIAVVAMPLARSTEEGLWGTAASGSRTPNAQVALDEILAQTVGLVVPVLRVVANDVTVEIPLGGTGSGFVISPAGHLLTNHHVIEDYLDALDRFTSVRGLLQENLGRAYQGASLTCLVFIESEQYDSQVVSRVYDREMDYALLQLEGRSPAGEPFPFLPLHPGTISGDHVARRLDSVMAVGFPGAAIVELDRSRALNSLPDKFRNSGGARSLLFREELPPIAFEYYVTKGVVSRVTQTGTRGAEMLMHDATISSGNSGGPLVDDFGHVLGINTLVTSTRLSTGDDILNTGYSIAVSIRSIYPHIRNHLPR